MLEDNDKRIAAFQKTIATTGDGFKSKVGATRPPCAQDARNISTLRPLISLDHDLIPARRAQLTAAGAWIAAQFRAACRSGLARHLHSTDTNRAYSRHNKLRIAD